MITKLMVLELCEKFTQYGGKPKYASCKIKFNDSEETEDVKFKLSTIVDEDEDDEIFYYCNNFNEFADLTDNTAANDFVLVDVYSLSME